MSPVELGLWSIGVVLLLIAARIPIGVVLGTVGFLGIAQLRGMDVAFGLIKNSPFEFSARWSLSAIPMFLLMGSIAYQSGISHALFRAARIWLGGLSGGLAVATNLACAVFAAASGSSVGTAAAMGRIAIPEMLRAGYDKGLATGVVASAGTLGSLIPPSILFLLYGVIAEVSVVKLMIAGILPGLLTAGVYTIMITVRCRLNPKLAPRLDPAATQISRTEKFRALAEVWPLLLLISGIIGGLYGGIVTPTEAGAVGAFLAFAITIAQRRMNFQILRDSLIESISASARIFFVAVGAIMYSKFLSLTGMPAFAGDLMGGWKLDPLLLVIGTSVIYVILGMFLDPIGVLLLTLPVLLPMFEALDLDLIWLGVLVVKYLEIGLLTPPVGLNVYVIKSVVGKEIPLETIFRGVGWFLVCEVFIVVVLVAFPQISLFLPSTMN
jgi:C4-dicarboxylate transporter, DctM subunit